ncbi:PKD domain-containing protein [Actinotalea fermentans]|nr:PKD domain-containing protein [Actinotalea fermentans]
MDTRHSAESEGDTVTVTAIEGRDAEQAAAGVAPAERLEEYKRRPECDPAIAHPEDSGVCFPGTPEEIGIRICGGETAVLPLWRRTRATTTSPWSDWVNVVAWTCPTDYLPALTAEDFRRLPLAPAPLTIQPNRTQHLVNLPTIVYTTSATQLLTTTLLGYPLEVEATPTTYTWDFGDGTTLTTTSPGHPYPHHDIAHPYPQPGTYTITLTTTLTGRYRLTGTTTWTPITGTATTTTTAPPITTTEAPTHLVTTDCHHTTTC